MASRHRPSLNHAIFYFLALVTALPYTDSDQGEEQFRKGLGALGRNYNLRRGQPYLQCEEYGPTALKNQTDCTPNNSAIAVHTGVKSFFGKKLGCNAVFTIKDTEKYKGKNNAGLVLDPSEYERTMMGCWNTHQEHHEQCLAEDECIAHVRERGQNGKESLVAFCCCTTHNCNSKVTVMFPIPNITEEVDEGGSLLNLTSALTDTSPLHPVAFPFLVFLVVALVLIFLLFICLCALRITKPKYFMRLLTGRGTVDQKVFDVQKTADEVPLVQVENGWTRANLKEGLVMDEIVASGKLGVVHKGLYKDPDTGKERAVAIKSIKEAKGFLLEEAAYRVCANTHPQMSEFIGSCFEPEKKLCYIVTEYQENGSLESYLKNAIFTPFEALTFLSSLMDGLAFLHAPQSLPNGGYKSAIVHRDIKSRNILVKADRTAVIADFGLAMICEGNRPYGRHYQVGTHRYMSPELLAGMADLNMDGLKMADVYAVSLIIWEILNRTKIDDEDEVCPAELPYTVEVDRELALDEAEFERLRSSEEQKFLKKSIQYYLKTIVYRDNRRPVLRERLKENPITAELARTTLDMWDFEVDGRISSACAHARLSLLKKDAIAGTIPRLS